MAVLVIHNVDGSCTIDSRVPQVPSKILDNRLLPWLFAGMREVLRADVRHMQVLFAQPAAYLERQVSRSKQDDVVGIFYSHQVGCLRARLWAKLRAAILSPTRSIASRARHWSSDIPARAASAGGSGRKRA